MKITIEAETPEEQHDYPTAIMHEQVFEFGLIGVRLTPTGPEPLQMVRHTPTNPLPLVEKAYGLLRLLEWLSMGVISPPTPEIKQSGNDNDGDLLPA